MNDLLSDSMQHFERRAKNRPPVDRSRWNNAVSTATATVRRHKTTASVLLFRVSRFSVTLIENSVILPIGKTELSLSGFGMAQQ